MAARMQRMLGDNGDNSYLYLQVGEVFSLCLKAQCENESPESMPWINQRILGRFLNTSSGGNATVGGVSGSHAADGVFAETDWRSTYYAKPEDPLTRSNMWIAD